MKKKSPSPLPKKKASKILARKKSSAPDEPLLQANPAGEANALADDQFAVAGREEEATTSGHRVEPIEADDEHNAENLIEEGLQGYMHGSLRKPRKTK